jgi:hypothetical protein
MMVGMRYIRVVIRWLLAALAVVLLVTGLGITHYQVVESLTFGWLGKALSHQVHTSPWLWVSFLVLFILHIVLGYIGRVGKKRAAS